MRKLTNVEEKILDKALYLIGKTGSFNVPIRMIAKEADVNVSAINYYFHSKEEMLGLVKEFYIDNTIAAYSALDNDEYNAREKVILCANEIMEYTIRYPGIMTVLKEASNSQEEDEISARIIKTSDFCNDKLDKFLAKILTGDESTFKHKKMIFLSSILHPTIHYDFYNIDTDLVDNKDKRLKYIDFVINMLNK
ncbi:MAG: TetR/AcrR family transcriptional regulator [Epulopiscium sp.]|nr:TetR/AcrR family transcriptional regulator [Candidatus Epulonipiscium sp.]